MLEAQVTREGTPSSSGKLKRDEFNEKFRLRDCREQKLVNCASCAFLAGESADRHDIAHCMNPSRVRRVRITQPDFREWNGAQDMVCDAYQSKPLPAYVAALTLKEGEGVKLNSQFGDCLHVDTNCPYVIEERRLAAIKGKTKYDRVGEVRIVDTTEVMPGTIHQDACDMPCCERRLRFQIWDPNGYRTRVGIHPNAHDPHIFVRNNLERHKKKSNMTYEEAETFFDGVAKIAADAKEKGVHSQIVAVSDYMHQHVNYLGSRPLSEATNPVWLWGIFHVLAVPAWLKKEYPWESVYDSTNSGADVWFYDERLFDPKSAAGKAFEELNPEGLIPCVDSKGVFKNVRRTSEPCGQFCIRGILKPLEDRTLISRGLTHFIDMREVSYHAYEHMWGESGIGFSATASFDEQ